MISLLEDLKSRNELLFWFGFLHFSLALLFAFLSTLPYEKIAGANAWYKPVKFALSIGIYMWTAGWLMVYLPDFKIQPTSWAIVILLGFEMAYIGLQAGRGEMSHFNIETPVRHTLYMLMALAAALVALITARMGWIFWTNEFPSLSYSYLWGIRLGMLLFVLFAFQGFIMGSQLGHTVGATDGGPGVPFLGWSLTAGDLRIAHFLGMHGMQILPLAGWLSGELRWPVWVIFALYVFVCLATLILALKGKPIILYKISKHEFIIEKAEYENIGSNFSMESAQRTGSFRTGISRRRPSDHNKA